MDATLQELQSNVRRRMAWQTVAKVILSQEARAQRYVLLGQPGLDHVSRVDDQKG